MNPRFSMLPGFYPITMHRCQVACFLSFIISLTWSACQTLPKAITGMVIARAGARALRVGIGKHAQHVNQGLNSLPTCHLYALHASPVRCHHHVTACQIMPLSLFGLGMLVAQPAPFQFFTSLTPCPACASLPNTITGHDYLPAPARALRVGIYPIVGHANCNVNTIQINDLPTEHAQTLGVIGRATQCQNKRNLLTSRAIVRSASVPRLLLRH